MKNDEITFKLHQLIKFLKLSINAIENRRLIISSELYKSGCEISVDEIRESLYLIIEKFNKWYAYYKNEHPILVDEQEYSLILSKISDLSNECFFIDDLNLDIIESVIISLKDELVIKKGITEPIIDYKPKSSLFNRADEIRPSDCKCYLTTACMRHYLNNFDDNCYELTVLRWFRDNFVSKEDIKHYYMTAPAIVKAINNDPNSDIIYDYIYDNVVDACVEAIENGDYEFAYNRYKSSILNLEKNIKKENNNNIKKHRKLNRLRTS